tara:strand:+ start:3674 stop:4576 length:903 start_codon:yes stop_codon:yes gene_type:complete
MLLYRPKPYDDECPVSYLVRVAEGNGFKNFGYLLRYSKVPIKSMESVAQDILTGDIELSYILSILGLEQQYYQTVDIYRKFRQGIDTPFVFVKHPKACPKCLEKYGYGKFIWSFFPVIACNEHNICLADIISIHTKRLSWQRTKLNPFSRVGFCCREANQETLAFNQYITSLILEKRLPNGLPLVLDGLELRGALTLIHLLSHFQSRLRNNYFNPTHMDVETLTCRYVDAWKALAHWPISFYDILDQYVGHAEKAVLERHFHSLFEHFVHHQDNCGIARIKEEFLFYIEDQRPSLIGYFN